MAKVGAIKLKSSLKRFTIIFLLSFTCSITLCKAATSLVTDLPAITTQPAIQVINNKTNTSSTFNVAASNSIYVTYQWYKKGQAIVGATSSSYTATGLTLADTAYTFNVIITNSNGSTVSSNAFVKFTLPSSSSATGNQAKQINFTQVKAYIKDKSVVVAWNIENESNIASYQIEKSTNGITFSTAGSINATGIHSYNFNDSKPANGINYYRVRSINKTGEVQYTNIVNVDVTALTKGSVGVYPNPLSVPSFTLTLTNMEKGSYTMSVVNSKGTTVVSKAISHSGGTASQRIMMNNNLTAGIYYITVVSLDGSKSTVKIMAN